MSTYALKPSGYFQHARQEIGPLLPAHARHVLEVGCGSGSTLGWLKTEGRCERADGIEIFEGAASEARLHADRVEVGNAEQLIEGMCADTPYDLVLCLDVLEHMVDPWRFMDRLAAGLAPGATVVASVPNIRHYRVSFPLLFLGRFRYEDAGVLDRTHLRFFTRESARALFDDRHFELQKVQGSHPPAFSFSWWLDLLTLGLMRDLFAVQYRFAARRR